MLRASAICTHTSTFPLAVSGNNRYLQTASGSPFLLNIAAASWMYIQAISDADFEAFALAQKARGFNTLHLSLISNDTLRFPSDSGNHYAAPNWNNGTTVPPFSTPGDFSTANTTYFAHARGRIDFLASIEMVAIVQVSYLGYNSTSGFTDEGWGQIMLADTNAHMTAYGQMVGALLLTCPNVIYGMGGDARPTVSSSLESRLKAVVDGVISVDPAKLWVAHWDGDTGSGSGGDLAFDQATFAAYSQLLWSHYAYNPGIQVYGRIATAYAHSPTRPALLMDESYENDPQGTPLELRTKQLTGMCAGSASLCYARGGASAAAGGWAFSADVNGTTGTTEHGYIWALWSAIPWSTMAPDTTSTFVTSGRGTALSSSYINARASAACLVAHFPHGAGATITISMSQFTGAGHASGSGVRRIRKFDPTSGAYSTLAASVATSGSVTIGASGTYTLGTNGAGDTDWLVVVD